MMVVDARGILLILIALSVPTTTNQHAEMKPTSMRRYFVIGDLHGDVTCAQKWVFSTKLVERTGSALM